MKVHLLGLPNTCTTAVYDLDGFNTLCMRFAKLLKGLGHHVILYAGEENEAPCDELVPVITKAEQRHHLHGIQYQHALIEAHSPLWQLANPRIAAEIGKRKQPKDLICTLGGGSQAPATIQHPDLLTVEYSIGYVGNFAPYRVFQSQAWRHVCYGKQGIDIVRPFDEVIPAFFEVEKFPVRDPEDYVCYVGRYIPRKGLKIVCDAAKLAGVKLKCIGHGDPNLITYGENLGPVHEAERNEVMARARALICPTWYIEPYGCISPEAQLSGTPVISSDAGGFTETVEHGYTGFRCNLLGEFVDAIDKVRYLDRAYIRQRAIEEYSMDTAALRYQAYFDRLQTLWAKGWDTLEFPVR